MYLATTASRRGPQDRPRPHNVQTGSRGPATCSRRPPVPQGTASNSKPLNSNNSEVRSRLYTYPTAIIDFNISTEVNKKFHHVKTVTPSCIEQGSPLMERRKQNSMFATTSIA